MQEINLTYSKGFMELINKIIGKMTKEEIRFYKLYLSRTNENSERKDVKLFNYIKKSGEQYDESYIFSKLYDSDKKNAFYRLKNRLSLDVNTSLYFQYFNKKQDLFTFFLLSIARLHFSRKQFEASYHFIQKAEQKALENENYDLLDLIYNEYIRFSWEIREIDPEVIIRKREENFVQLSKLRRIEDTLAVVSKKIYSEKKENFPKTQVLSIINKATNDIISDLQIKNPLKFRIKIYQTVSQILLNAEDYVTLEIYLMSTFLDYNEENIFEKSDPNLKLDLLKRFVFTLYKNKKYERSIHYAEKIFEYLKIHKTLKEDYLFDYYDFLVRNYLKFNTVKAIQVLDEMKSMDDQAKIESFDIYIYLMKAKAHYNNNEFHKAIGNLYKMFLCESYNNADPVFKLRIFLFELILRYEIGDMDYVEDKLDDAEKTYEETLSSRDNEIDAIFIRIFKLLLVQNKNRPDKRIIAAIDQLMNKKLQDQDVLTNVVDYKKWIKDQITLPA